MASDGTVEDEGRLSQDSSYDMRLAERSMGLMGTSVGADSVEPLPSETKLLDAIDKQNKRLEEIRDAVAHVDWSFIRGTGLGMLRSAGSGWVRTWDVGVAEEG
jgi:hypothetical protein